LGERRDGGGHIGLRVRRDGATYPRRSIWPNDGAGRLSFLTQDFSDAPVQRMMVADVNADGDLDLFLGHHIFQRGS
jgi:hypothetical protein